MKVGPLVNPEFGIDLRYCPRKQAEGRHRLRLTLLLLATRGLKIVDAGDIAVPTLEEGHESLASTVGKIIGQGPCAPLY